MLAMAHPLVDLGPSGPGGAYIQSTASGINDSSWIVGTLDGEAAVWTPQAGFRAVGFLGSGNSSVLYGISNSGEAVGGSTTLGGSYSHAVVWDTTSGLRDLNNLIANRPTTWTPTGAIAISGNDLIAGIGYSNISTSPPSGAEHAFVLDAGSLTEIPDPAGSAGLGIQPESINSSGEVAGFYSDANNQEHAFLYTAALGTRDIGNLDISATGGYTSGTGALAINDFGTIVGGEVLADGSTHAFLWTESGGMVEVNPPSGVVFNTLAGINDDGQLIGQGYYLGNPAIGYRGFVLTPVPEPPTIFLGLPLVLATFAWIIRGCSRPHRSR